MNYYTHIIHAGVKEAFLKVAQGVISLFQHNQLKASSGDPSYSTLNSYTVGQSQMLSNGHSSPVPVDTVKPTVDDSGYIRRCCGS